MTFKGRRIKGGDVLWTATGEKYIISDWSEETGDIYLRSDNSPYISMKRVPELTWDYPFITRRIARG